MLYDYAIISVFKYFFKCVFFTRPHIGCEKPVKRIRQRRVTLSVRFKKVVKRTVFFLFFLKLTNHICKHGHRKTVVLYGLAEICSR